METKCWSNQRQGEKVCVCGGDSSAFLSHLHLILTPPAALYVDEGPISGLGPCQPVGQCVKPLDFPKQA